jgi:hypothetical protein
MRPSTSTAWCSFVRRLGLVLYPETQQARTNHRRRSSGDIPARWTRRGFSLQLQTCDYSCRATSASLRDLRFIEAMLETTEKTPKGARWAPKLQM